MSIKAKALSIAHNALKSIRRAQLKKKDFTIISNNCWGGFVSQHFDLPYNSPFVGLFIFAPDYIKMLKNLDEYLDTELVFIRPSDSRYVEELKKSGTLKHPVALVNDVEIHFLHYKDEQEAKEKWHRRKQRINRKNLIFKFCDRDLATASLIEEFDRLPFTQKICLTAHKYNLPSCLKLKNEDGEFVENEWDSFVKTINIVNFINRHLES